MKNFAAVDSASLRPRVPAPGQEKGPRGLGGPSPSNTPLQTSLVIQQTKDEEGLNQLETAFLRELRGRGFDWLGIQPWGFKLASDRTRYHPDFVTLGDGQLTAWETKGAQFWDDAKVKLKVAARQYPFIRFVLVKREKDGQWIEQEVKP